MDVSKATLVFTYPHRGDLLTPLLDQGLQRGYNALSFLPDGTHPVRAEAQRPSHDAPLPNAQCERGTHKEHRFFGSNFIDVDETSPLIFYDFTTVRTLGFRRRIGSRDSQPSTKRQRFLRRCVISRFHNHAHHVHEPCLVQVRP